MKKLQNVIHYDNRLNHDSDRCNKEVFILICHCKECGYTFEISLFDAQCPDCGKFSVDHATEKQKQDYLRIQAEFAAGMDNWFEETPQ